MTKKASTNDKRLKPAAARISHDKDILKIKHKKSRSVIQARQRQDLLARQKAESHVAAPSDTNNHQIWNNNFAIEERIEEFQAQEFTNSSKLPPTRNESIAEECSEAESVSNEYCQRHCFDYDENLDEANDIPSVCDEENEESPLGEMMQSFIRLKDPTTINMEPERHQSERSNCCSSHDSSMMCEEEEDIQFQQLLSERADSSEFTKGLLDSFDTQRKKAEHLRMRREKTINNKNTNSQNALPPNRKALLYEGSDFTVEQFANDLYYFFSYNEITKSAEEELMMLLYKYFNPIVKLPIGYTSGGGYKSVLDNYITSADIGDINGNVVFDACEEGCTVYAEAHENDLLCASCETPRYEKCNQPDCSSFTAEMKCHHSNKKRTPKHQIIYRPIIPFLSSAVNTANFQEALISYPQLDDYEKSLNKSTHENIIDEESQKAERCPRDILFGNHTRKHLKEMHSKFNDEKKKNHNLDSKALEEVSLVLSLFYDGCQVFKNQTSHFWPILTSICNVDVAKRNIFGYTTILQSIFVGKQMGSEEESFILDRCLVGELLRLEDGVIVEDTNDAHRLYFLQARLCSLIFDTKGLEKVLHVKNFVSNAGCHLCRNMHGVYYDTLGVNAFTGHRSGLRLSSILRSYGQNQKCCSDMFYATKECKPKKVQDIHNSLVSSSSSSATHTPPVLPKQIAYSADVRLCGGDIARRTLTSIICDRTKDYSSTLDPALLTAIKPFLYYQHCDYRAQVDLGARVTNSTYLKDGREALNRQRSSFYVNGIQKPSVFSVLRSFDFAKSFSFCPMHAMSGSSYYILSELTGYRFSKNKNKVIKHCLAVQTHPILVSSNGLTEPWRLSPSGLEMIEQWLSCLLFPCGVASEYNKLTTVFSKVTELSSVQKIDVIKVLGGLIAEAACVANQLYPAYRAHLVIMNRLFAELFRLSFSSLSELKELEYRIIEALSIREGLYPEVESVMLFHELVHLPSFIYQNGPIKGWWGCPGERDLKRLKSMMPEGGQNFVKTVMNRACRFQRAVFNSKLYRELHCGLSSDVRPFCDTMTPYVSVERNFLDRLISCFREDILGYYKNNDELSYERSAMFRLIDTYSMCIALAKKSKTNYTGCYNKDISINLVNCSYSSNDSRTVLSMGQAMVLRINISCFLNGSPERILDQSGCRNDIYYGIHRFFETLLLLYERGQSYIFYPDNTVLDEFNLWLREEDLISIQPWMQSLYISKHVSSSDKRLIIENVNKSRKLVMMESINLRCRDHYNTETIPNKQLKLNWWSKDSYSSWCLFDSKSTSSSTKEKDLCAAQLKYYFRVSKLYNEEAINGKLYASIEARYTTKHGEFLQLFRVSTTDSESLVKETYEILPVTQLYPTEIAIIGFTKDNHPILKDAVHISKESANYLILVPLHPEHLFLNV